MIDEKELKAQARLIAIEHMIANQQVMIYRLAGMTPAAIADTHEKALKMLREQTFPGGDPAQSDLWAAEIETAFASLLSEIEGLLKAAKK
jgi:hypothetical protein